MLVADVRTLTSAERAAIAALIPPYFAEIAPDLPVPSVDRIARWWTDTDRFAFSLMNASELSGFALVRHLENGSHEMSEFYVRPEQRRNGLGRAFAKAVLLRFPGRWQLGVASGASNAKSFWNATLATCREVGHIRSGPPLMPLQSASLHFIVTETSDA